MADVFDSMFTESNLSEGAREPVLGPAYFASRRIAQEFMAKFTAEQFKPLIDEFADKFRHEMWTSVEYHMLNDVESNLQGSMWKQVDEIVKGLLSGTQWTMDRYVLGERYDCETVRAAVAKHIPGELQEKRIADLEAENEKLRADNDWLRRNR